MRERTHGVMEQRPSKSDRMGLYVAVGISVVWILVAAVSTVDRLLDVAAARDVPVTIPLVDVLVDLPLGAGGESYPATVESATFIVPAPSPGLLVALWAEPLVVLLCTAGLLFLAVVFLMRLARGDVFSRGTARLVYWALGILVIQILAGFTLTNTIITRTLIAVSDGNYDGFVIQFDLTPLLWAVLLAGAAATLQIGERLHKDTEGLV